jgi:hypothetical protein
VWAKGDQLYSGRKRKGRHSKVSVSRKGILKIKDIDYKEAGRYTCLGRATGQEYVKFSRRKKYDNMLSDNIVLSGTGTCLIT